MEHSLFYSPEYSQVIALYDYTAKDTLEKCYSTLRQVDMHGSLCIANLFTQNIPTVPGPLWVWIPPMSQLQAIALVRAFDPGAWVRIAFDVRFVASIFRGEPFVKSKLQLGQTSQLVEGPGQSALQSAYFFLSGCCMAQRRSLSGRSPFCQLKLSEKSQIHWKSFSTKATNLKLTMKQNHQPRCSLPESAGEGG